MIASRDINSPPPVNRTKMSYSASDYRSFQIKLLMRISMLLCFIMVASNVILSLSLIQISSSLQVNSVVLTKQDSSGNMVVVEQITPNMSNSEVLNEVMLRRYIIMRHTVISNTNFMGKIWGPRGPLRHMSSGAVYNKFYVDERTFQGRIREINNNPDKAQEVDIIEIKKLASNLWGVDFDLITYHPVTGIPKREHWNASVRASNYPERKMLGRSFINPLGFVVTEYNLAQKIVK